MAEAAEPFSESFILLMLAVTAQAVKGTVPALSVASKLPILTSVATAFRSAQIIDSPSQRGIRSVFTMRRIAS